MPFFLGVVAGTSMSYLMLPVVAGVCIGILGILAIFAPFPAASESGKSESFISNLKNAHFSIESIALILIGFTSTATFQLWLNCAQTFGTEIAKIPSQNVSVMQTYYSAGTMVALFVTSALITKFKQVRFLVIYPAISLVMLALVYIIKTPMICYVGAFVIGYAAAGGVLQMATAVVNDLFPKIKGTITSLVMIASSLCNYTILTAAAKMTSTSVIMMNIVITAIGILLALFVNVRYGVLLKNAEEASKNLLVLVTGTPEVYASGECSDNRRKLSMNTVKVRNIEIGSGVPKICVPIVGVTKDEIIAEAKTFDSIPVDVVEWRVDWFEGVFEFDKVEDVLKDLREALGETPILFTFRTSKEGGEKAIEAEPYKELNIAAAKTGYVDLVDVEAFTGDEIVKEIVAAAHECGVKVVASNHDFDKTPEKDEIVRRLCKMQELGADIPKIAVMPTCRRDVLTLLCATEEMYTEHADRPIITMSMAGTGLISRLCGEVFGSALTFGAAKKASAPGQAAVNDLNNMLQFLHENQGL